MINKENIIKVVGLFIISILIIAGTGTLLPNEMAVMTTKDGVTVEKKLIPGGNSVGVRMKVKGVLVVALEDIETESSIVAPALNGGVQVGNTILSIDGMEVSDAEEVSEILGKSTKDHEFIIEIKRKDEISQIRLKPALDTRDGKLKLGMWVKEKIAGIGTLTYVDPETYVYGALGHGIYERETMQLLGVKEGNLIKTEVRSIKEGNPGEPGAIMGVFVDIDEPIGSLNGNTESGIYGKYKGDHSSLNKPISIGTKNEIEKGKAYIYTTLQGNKIEKFQIEIKKIHRLRPDKSKGLEIKVVDKKLLSTCGGIVQGMSGSPIIQKGKIVGAVTHVFVNDPTTGYGIFIENMIETAADIGL